MIAEIKLARCFTSFCRLFLALFSLQKQRKTRIRRELNAPHIRVRRRLVFRLPAAGVAALASLTVLRPAGASAPQ